MIPNWTSEFSEIPLTEQNYKTFKKLRPNEIFSYHESSGKLS